jgi:hypothetical protein
MANRAMNFDKTWGNLLITDGLVDNNKKMSTEYEFNNQYNNKGCNRMTPKKWKQLRNNIGNGARSYNRCCGKAVETAHSEFVFTDLVTQDAECLCPVILSSVASPALQVFLLFFFYYCMSSAIRVKTFMNITYVFSFCFSFCKEFGGIWS